MLMRFIHGQIGLDMLVAWLVAVTVAITVHEFGHAKSAELAGDSTPRAEGRVTLNPVAHYDLIGSTLFLVFGFGWAKPVPINPVAFRHPRRDTVLVSLWGPLSNFVTAALLSLPLRFHVAGPYTMAVAVLVYANLMLGVFNLIPIGPLDGAHILEGLLTDRANMRLRDFYRRNQRWLILIFLIVFLVPSVADPVFRLIALPVEWLMRLLTGVGF